ncbi:MAG: alpha/beta hydrolase [Burkholderiaceae bacterium]|nr:alpha/beta hydrolase [Thauera sp.]MCP5290106.1 alpha/beta hydrolase [Burkholderiaceae bacterium]
MTTMIQRGMTRWAGRLAGVALSVAGALAFSATAHATPTYEVTKIENLAYGPATPGNLLDLYLPDVPGKAKLPLVIWHSGSAWFSNSAKNDAGARAVAAEFTARGYAVATISIRSSLDARFPAQGHDVRAAVRWLRTNADQYGIDAGRFAFMGNSSGGWATAFAATTSDILELPGEQGVNGVSSAVHVAVPFFPPTDFLSMDDFAAANGLPQGFAYPHSAPTSPEGFLIQCPGEPAPVFPPIPAVNPGLVSIQACPDETEAADPSTYIEGEEVPMWVLHGLQDPLLPFNQSLLVYETTVSQGNEARITIVPSAGHSVNDIINAPAATTWTTNRGGQETVVEGMGPSWDDIEHFLHVNLNRARGPAR